MVFDWGGGTFDVTIAQMIASKFGNNCDRHHLWKVRTSAGDSFLGGRDVNLA